MKNRWLFVLSFVVIFSMFLVACQPAATEAPAPAETEEQAPPETEEPAPVETEAETTEEAPPAEGVTEIRWFIGLGAGSNPEEVEKEQAFVDKFNAENPQYNLVMDVVANETAYDVLKTQVASGDVPDIVGPVGVRGFYSFEGAWEDLTPYIESTGYDLSDFNPSLVEFYQFTGMGQVGLPFAVYPSALWYNVDLFDEAGLDYPPHEFGAPYADGDDWTFDKLRELGLYLTVDANGNDSTMEGFDPENVVQFGYDAMWTDIRGAWTFFGAASFVDENGNAQMPEVWREAAHWYYDGMWSDVFIPNGNYVNSDMLAQGNTFGSGNVAMSPIHTWYTCCFQGVNWDVAAIPSYDGNITAKLHADTFGILKDSKNKDAAFDVLSMMLGKYASDLLTVYAGFPARESLQESAVASMQEQYPNADIQVFVDALSYPDNPNHESGMPNFNKASDAYTAFGGLYTTTPDLDLDAELDNLVQELQTIFDEVK